MALRDLTLPRLGETMDSALLVKWLSQPGDWCARGQTLLELETDKTVVELPNLVAGRLVEIVRLEGEQVEVGAVIARIDVEGDVSGDVEGNAGAERQAPAIVASGAFPSVDPQPEVQATPAAAAPPQTLAANGPQRATPVARRLAARHGIELAGLQGSGRRGRVEADDVRRAVGREAPAGGAGGQFHPATARSGGLAWRSWTAQVDNSQKARATLVLLHGFGGDSQTWAAMGAHLSRAGHPVLAPDLPAHGQSLAEADDVEALIAPLQRWLAATCSGPYELVGHSMGALAALRLASRPMVVRPQRVTLFAPIGLGSEIDAGFVPAMAGVDNVDTLTHLLRKLTVRPPGLSARQLLDMVACLGPRGRLHTLADALVHGGHQRVDSLPAIQALGAGVRVVVGLDDRIVPWQQVLNLSPATAVHLLRQAGHMLHWDAPAAAAALFG